MKKYALELAGALGIGEIIGIPAVTTGVSDATWLQTVIGAGTVLLIWALKHEALIKDAVTSVEELVHEEKAPVVAASPAMTATEVKDALVKAASPAVESVLSNAPLTAAERTAIADAWSKVNAADPKPTA